MFKCGLASLAEKAVKMGCITAGLAATQLGAVDSIPTLEEIKKIYEQNY